MGIYQKYLHPLTKNIINSNKEEYKCSQIIHYGHFENPIALHVMIVPPVSFLKHPDSPPVMLFSKLY